MRRIAATLAFFLPVVVLAQEGAWIGRTVITRDLKVKLLVDDGANKNYIPLDDNISYRVDAEKGDQLRVITTRGVVGWMKKSDAMLPEQAIGHFNDQLFKNPKDVDAFHKRSYAWELMGDLDAALRDINFAIEQSGLDMAGFNSRGLIYLAKRDYKNAIADLGLSIRLQPNAAAAYCNRGQAFTAVKEYKKAINDLNRAVQLEPGLSFAWSNRGLALFLAQQYDQAMSDFDMALGLDPRNSQAMLNQARMLATCAEAKYRDGKKAVELAQKALKLDEHPDGDAQQVLAAAFAEVGEFVRAIQVQQKALEDPHLKNDKDARARLELYRKKTPYRQN